MPKIHVATEDCQAEYEEAQVRLQWQQGKLPLNAKYWKQGMTDWEPLSGYFGSGRDDSNPYAPPSPEENRTGPTWANGRYSYTKPPGSLTRLLIIMLIICIGTHVISLLGYIAQMSLLSGDYTEMAAETNNARQQMIGIGSVLIFLLTSIIFLRWISRANLNCRGFRARDMIFTPGWSIGWYFVPVMNLFKPYQVMKEIWQVSHDPVNWKNVTGTGLIGWWWTLWLLSGILEQIVSRLFQHADEIPELQAVTAASMVVIIIDIILSLVALAMVRKIFMKQEELVNRDSGEIAAAS